MDALVASERRGVKRAREELGEERAAFATEKAAMATVVQKSDIIKLNVGGQLFMTKRATLTQEEDSVLAGMFSGRWEGSFDKDPEGHIFLDFNPVFFGKVLDQLRSNQLRGKPVAWRDVPAPGGERECFHALLYT